MLRRRWISGIEPIVIFVIASPESHKPLTFLVKWPPSVMSFLYPASWGASEHLAEAQTSPDKQNTKHKRSCKLQKLFI
jgi:hypothetical protein